MGQSTYLSLLKKYYFVKRFVSSRRWSKNASGWPKKTDAESKRPRFWLTQWCLSRPLFTARLKDGHLWKASHELYLLRLNRLKLCYQRSSRQLCTCMKTRRIDSSQTWWQTRKNKPLLEPLFKKVWPSKCSFKRRKKRKKPRLRGSASGTRWTLTWNAERKGRMSYKDRLRKWYKRRNWRSKEIRPRLKRRLSKRRRMRRMLLGRKSWASSGMRLCRSWARHAWITRSARSKRCMRSKRAVTLLAYSRTHSFQNLRMMPRSDRFTLRSNEWVRWLASKIVTRMWSVQLELCTWLILQVKCNSQIIQWCFVRCKSSTEVVELSQSSVTQLQIMTQHHIGSC